MMNTRSITYRNRKSNGFRLTVVGLAFVCTLPLLGILFYIIKKGVKAVNWSFLTQLPKPVGEVGGGVLNAWTGSLMIILLAAIIAIPFGIIIGIYLSENPTKRLTGWARISADILQGVPSIVIGIVAYFWIVRPMNGFSAFSGSIALAIMMLPIVVRSTEETLKLLPATLKEASLALGTSYHKTIFKVVLPCGMNGILSGVLLAIARVTGETAPLLFTAFGNPYLNFDTFKAMGSLPLQIYNYAISPYEQWHAMAWGAAMILLVWILLLNILTQLTRLLPKIRKWKKQS